MRRTRKRRPKQPVTYLQLCLFSADEMLLMAEPPPAVKAADQIAIDKADPGWLMWQLDIAQALRGRGWRQHMAMLTSKKRKDQAGSVAWSSKLLWCVPLDP